MLTVAIRKELVAVLCAAFARNIDAFQRLFTTIDPTKPLDILLPPGSPLHVISEGVELLWREGLLAELSTWRRLIDAALLYEDELLALAARGGFPVEALPVPAPSRLPVTPYKDLAPFTANDALIFFGRREAIQTILHTLRDPTPQVVLVVGPSGVGKSSLLQAGVLPRGGADFHGLYVAHSPGGTLLDSLERTLGGADMATTWAAREQELGIPLVVVLDQVESAYTTPDGEARGDRELAALLAAFPGGASAVRGKLVLGVRKEWLAEVLRPFDARGLAPERIEVPRLDERGIREIVFGPTRRGLHETYHLSFDEGVVEQIVADLVADRQSPIAPTLQVLMKQLWSGAAREGMERRITCEQYRALGHREERFKGFIEHRILEMAGEQGLVDHPALRERVDAGVALDLLYECTTEERTARTVIEDELVRRYGGDEFRALIDACENQRLLRRNDREHGKPTEVSLTHDLVAPVVGRLFRESMLPGPKARRLLLRLCDAYRDAGASASAIPRVDSADLLVLEQGRAGMRTLDALEQKIIAENRRRIDSEEAARAERIARDQLAAEDLARITADAAEKELRAAAALATARAEKAAEQAKAARKLAWWGGLIGAAAMLAAVAALWQYTAAKQSSSDAEAARSSEKDEKLKAQAASAHLQEELGSKASAEGDYAAAAVHLGEALRLGGTSARLDYLLNKTSYALNCQLSSTDFGSATVLDVVFLPDGPRAIVTDGTIVEYFRVPAGPIDRNRDLITTVEAPGVAGGRIQPNGSGFFVWDSGTARFCKDQPADECIAVGEHAIVAAEFSRDSRRLATSTMGGETIVWALGPEIAEVTRFTSRKADRVTPLAFNDDGERVAVVAEGLGTAVKVFSAVTGEMLHSLVADECNALLTPGSEYGISALALTHDGERLVAGRQGGTVKLWPLSRPDDQETHEVHRGGVTAAVASPDDRQIATASDDGTIRVDLDDSRKLLGHVGPVRCIAFSDDGQRLISAGDDGTVKIWSTNFSQSWRAIAADAGDRFLTTSRDGEVVILPGADRTSARVFRVQPWETTDIGPHDADIDGAASSRDGSRIALWAYGDRGSVSVWDVASPSVPRFRQQDVVSSALSSDGTRLLITKNDGAVQVCDIDKETVLGEWPSPGKDTIKAQFDPSDSLVLGFGPGASYLWHLSRGADSLITVPHAPGPQFQVHFSANGRFLIGEGDVGYLHGLDGTMSATLRGHFDDIWSGVWSADGQLVVTGSVDDTARIWDSQTGKMLNVMDVKSPVRWLGMSHEASLIVVRTQSDIQVWTLHGEQLELFPCSGLTPAGIVEDGSLVVALCDGNAGSWRIRWKPRSVDEVLREIRCKTSVHLAEGRMIHEKHSSDGCDSDRSTGADRRQH